MVETQHDLNHLCADTKKKRTPQEALSRLYLTLKMRTLRRKLVDYLVKHVIKPFGIPRGSEKQGWLFFSACVCACVWLISLHFITGGQHHACVLVCG